MNKEVKKIDIERILFFDIETVRRHDELKINSKEFELYALSLRDKQTGYVPPSKEVMRHYEKNGALKPEYNKIVAISVAYITEGVLYYKAITGSQEKIIEEFYNVVESRGFKVCGHNIIGFDIPVTRIKAFEEGIEHIPVVLNDSGKKPWDMEKDAIDTMKLLTGSYYSNISLDSACMLRGIESSKDDISGPYVSEVFYKEGVERIATYCNKDVIATAELFCSLTGREGIIKNYVDRGKKVLKEKEKVNALKHIMASSHLSSTIVKQVLDFTERHDLNKEDVLVLIKTALSKERPYQKVEEEDYQELKTCLGLDKDYSLIPQISDKGNMGAKESKALIKEYKNRSLEDKTQLVNIVIEYLTEKGKIEKTRTAAALKLLKSSLLNQ